MSTNAGCEAPLVTILVPCYNYGRYLENCLDRIFAQTVLNDVSIEIIVINDGSTDNTDLVMRKYTDPRIRYVSHERNRGICYTLAEGLRLARGKYFARIDADDKYKPHFLATTLPVLESDPEVGVVYGDVARMDESGNVVEDPWTGIRSRENHNGQYSRKNEYFDQILECTIPTAAVIGRTELWQKGIPFPENFIWESPSDWWLNIRACQSGMTVYLPETLGEYRVHASSISHQEPDIHKRETTSVGALDVLSADWSLSEWWSVGRTIYANIWAGLAKTYFSYGDGSNARKCFLRTLVYRPQYIYTQSVGRLFFASLLPREFYERLKKLLKSIR